MPIKILGLCGSPIKGSNTEIFLEEALSAVTGPEVEGEIYRLADKRVEDCRHCNWCLAKQTEIQVCHQEDDLADLLPKVAAADGLLVASPVYLGRPSGRLSAALDRLRSLHYGKLTQGSLKYKVAAGLAVGWYRNAGIETTLTSLHLCFLTYQMLIAVPGSNCTFGGTGVSSLEGTGRFDPDDRTQIRRDEFGLSTARQTARAVLDLIRLVRRV